MGHVAHSHPCRKERGKDGAPGSWPRSFALSRLARKCAISGLRSITRACARCYWRLGSHPG